MHSRTDQISLAMSDDWRVSPFTVTAMAPSAGWPMSWARRMGPIGAEMVPPGADMPTTGMGWEVYPDGLRELLVWLHDDYGPIPLLVTENGAAFGDDTLRLAYLARHLGAAASAIEAGIIMTRRMAGAI